MHDWVISAKLKKVLRKLFKKDKIRYEATIRKITEIVKDPTQYKNLKYNLKHFRRVHIDSHFVLIFKIEGDMIKFEDLQHHDHIYKTP